jgi:hypothetical protein
MDELDLNPNEGASEVVDTQIDVVDTGVTDSQVADVKPVQSQEDNARFAQARRDKEADTQKSIDAEYSRLFGTEYGIHTKAAYDAAIAEQQRETERQQFQEQNGFDPNTVKPLFEEWKKSDPDFQELSHIRQEKSISAALSDLNNELKDCGMDLQLKDLSDAEVAKIPNVDKVTELVSKGKTLSEAFFLANKKEIISKQTAAAQQDTIKKIAANGLSSPGSLSGGGDSDSKTIYSMSKSDFAKMQAEVLRGERKQL